MGIDDLLKAMKAADPERLKRLEEMGYDTSKVYFHGTDANFKEFDPNKSMGSYGAGIYFTNKPETTDVYSKAFREDNFGGRTIPVFLKKGEYLNARNDNLTEEGNQIFADKVMQILEESPEKYRLYSDYSTDGTIEDGQKVFKNMAKNTSPFNAISELWDYGYNKRTDDLGKVMTKNDLMGFKADFPKFNEDYKIVPDADNIKSIWAKGLEKKGLMAGVAAAPMVSMNPLEPLSDILGGYRGVQEKVADAITERTSFVKPDSTQKALGRAVIDPLNLIEGPAALGAMFIDAITPRKENE